MCAHQKNDAHFVAQPAFQPFQTLQQALQLPPKICRCISCANVFFSSRHTGLQIQVTACRQPQARLQIVQSPSHVQNLGSCRHEQIVWRNGNHALCFPYSFLQKLRSSTLSCSFPGQYESVLLTSFSA